MQTNTNANTKTKEENTQWPKFYNEVWIEIWSRYISKLKFSYQKHLWTFLRGVNPYGHWSAWSLNSKGLLRLPQYQHMKSYIYDIIEWFKIM